MARQQRLAFGELEVRKFKARKYGCAQQGISSAGHESRALPRSPGHDDLRSHAPIEIRSKCNDAPCVWLGQSQHLDGIAEIEMVDLVGSQPVESRERVASQEKVDRCGETSFSGVTAWEMLVGQSLAGAVGFDVEAAFVRKRLKAESFLKSFNVHAIGSCQGLRSIDLSHAAGANVAGDLVGPEFGAGTKHAERSLASLPSDFARDKRDFG